MTRDVDATKTIPLSPPFVTLSYAQTLDGRLATSTGTSQWISAPESLLFSHELRAEHDAIMVGVGTVCVDDPRLTVRLAAGSNPLRVVVDSTLRTPLTAAVLTEEAAPGTVLAVTDSAPAARCDKVRALGATVLCLPTDADGRVDLVALLTVLRQLGVASVLVEGGAQMITALLKARLIDRLVVCVAPKILGAGIEAVGDLGIRELARSLIVADTSVTRCGADLVFEGRVEYPLAPPPPSLPRSPSRSDLPRRRPCPRRGSPPWISSRRRTPGRERPPWSWGLRAGSAPTLSSWPPGARVIVTARRANEAFVRKLGTAETIDHTREDIVESVRAAHPEGIETIIDVVSAPDVLSRMARLLKKGGRLASSVYAADTESLAERGIDATNVGMQPSARRLEELSWRVDAGEISVNLDRTFPLEKAHGALEEIKKRHVRGKIVLLVE